MKYKYNLIKKVMPAIPIISVLGIFLLSIYFHNTLLNRILSNRLLFSYFFLKSTDLKSFILGTKEEFNFPLDNSWIALLHDYGIIVLIIMLILMTLGIKKMFLLESKLESKKIVFLFLICLFYSISETVLFSPYYSFIVMILIEYNFVDRRRNIESRNLKKSTINNA